MLGVIAAAALAWAAASALRPRPQAAVESPLAVEIVVGSDNLYNALGASFALTPDGNTLAYVESGASERRLFIRRLDQLQATPAAIDEVRSNGPYHPFVSPDGNWIGYALPNELRKVQVTGGAPLTVCKVSRSRGATWLADDTIVFTKDPTSGLSRVPAAGGEPQPLTTLDEERGEVTHRWPQALPDGKHVLFTSHAGRPNFDTATLEVVSVATGERKVVYQGGSYGRYAPTGHLLFVNRGTLFAIPFDLDSLETRGAPVPVLQKLATSPSEGGAQFDFSATGRLVYSAAETAEAIVYPIVWVDRDGRSSPLLEEPGIYANPRISPDGTRLALTVLREGNWDIWVYDLERGVSTRLTFDEGVESEQIWSPDGQELIFSSDRDGPDALYRKRADGSGESERLTEPQFAQWASSWSPDGRYVSFIESPDAVRPGYPRPRERRNETVPRHSVRRGVLGHLAQRPLPGLRLERVRDVPGLRSTVPQPARASGRCPTARAPRRDGARTGASCSGATTPASSPRRSRSRAPPSAPESRSNSSPAASWAASAGVGAGGLSFADYDVTPDGKRFVMFPDADERNQRRPSAPDSGHAVVRPAQTDRGGIEVER